jgi:hypothetical protein
MLPHQTSPPDRVLEVDDVIEQATHEFGYYASKSDEPTPMTPNHA